MMPSAFYHVAAREDWSAKLGNGPSAYSDRLCVPVRDRARVLTGTVLDKTTQDSAHRVFLNLDSLHGISSINECSTGMRRSHKDGVKEKDDLTTSEY
jgi:hypothetical protein